jgi:hypothetical protein
MVALGKLGSKEGFPKNLRERERPDIRKSLKDLLL